MTSRYEFLTSLHELLHPAVYLEVGVQHGWSLQLSKAPLTIGIDPEPSLTVPVPQARIYEMPSDEFFTFYAESVGAQIDLAFVDGMHLYEYALRDFMGTERMAHHSTIVVVDDVLPRTQEMAAREMCPGDWTGDVYKLEPVLRRHRPDLHLTLVDTEPTGVMVIRNLDPASVQLANRYNAILRNWPPKDEPVPEKVLSRSSALPPARVLADLEPWRAA